MAFAAWLQSSTGNGIRNAAATAYLGPALSRPNLDVLVETQVTKLIQTGISLEGKPVFRGVEFAQSSSCKAHCDLDFGVLLYSSASCGLDSPAVRP